MTTLTPHVYLGLDLGQRHDPAALAVLERTQFNTGVIDRATWEPELQLHFALRHLQRFPLGTPYLEIVRRVRAVLPDLPKHAHKTLVIDASGVGAPVVEIFRHAGLRATLYPITISATGKPHSDPHGGYIVPRRDLITNLLLLFERRILQLPAALPLRQDFIEELLSLRDRSGAAHDDLALATTLAAWPAARSVLHLLDKCPGA